jgi:hypothetical protein
MRTELRRRVSRNTAIIAALFALFLLLGSGDLTEAELFGLKVQRFNFILLVIPIAVAYVFLSTIAAEKAAAAYIRVIQLTTRRYFSSWRESELDTLLTFSSAQISTSINRAFFKAGFGRKVLWTARIVEFGFMTLFPAAFLAFAYVSLVLASPAIPLIGTAVSAMLALIFIALGWLNYAKVEILD